MDKREEYKTGSKISIDNEKPLSIQELEEKVKVLFDNEKLILNTIVKAKALAPLSRAFTIIRLFIDEKDEHPEWLLHIRPLIEFMDHLLKLSISVEGKGRKDIVTILGNNYSSQDNTQKDFFSKMFPTNY